MILVRGLVQRSPVFLLTEPSPSVVQRFIASQRDQPFTYADIGATNSAPPQSFTVDHNRILIGRGGENFNLGVVALQKWRQFDLGWVSIVPEDVPIEVGAIVAVKAHAFGTWSLSAARIVYLINEESRFGFAYGTLPDHVECGEERFMIEWNRDDDSVWYDIVAFSKPRQPLVILSFPLARMLQKRFARESLTRMVAEVSGK